MKNFKKVVAAGLALLMLALSVNVSFAAENYTEKEAVVVAKVNAAGIMTGTDKGFEPSKTLTRAEAAAIFVRMKGISEDTVKQNAGTTLFTDVAASHWAAGYINVASNYGIIKGVGANKFAPEKEVTVAEFYTMAVRALNAGQLVEAEGTWPTNYVNFAIENDLAEDVAQIYTAASTRMTAATIIANTLEAVIWTKSGYKSNGEVTFEPKGGTVLASLNIEEQEDQTITLPDTKKLKATVTAYGANTKFNERAGLANAKKGLSYTVWYDTNEKEVLGFWLPKDNKVVEFTNIKDFEATGEVKLTVDGEETKFKTKSCSLEINENEDADLDNYDLPVFGVAYYGTGDDSEKIMKIYAESYDLYGVVKDVTEKKVTFEDASKVKGATLTGSITIDLDKDSSYKYAVTKDGKEISIADIEKGDVVFGYYRADNRKDYVLNVYEDTVEGKISAKSNSKVTVDGTKYELINDVANAGEEGTLYLAQNGKAVMFNPEKKVSDVAMISAMKLTTSDIVGSSAKLMIKYTDMNGTTSDWTEVDSKNTTSAIYSTLTEKPDDTVLPKYSLIGTLVAYEMKSGKIVIKANPVTQAGNINKDTLYFGITAFTDAKTDTITADGKTWFLTSDVKVFEKDANNEEGYKKEVTLKEINVEDLDDIPSSEIGVSYMADLDYTQRTAGVLVLEKTNIIAEKNWAVVLDVAVYSDDDDDTKEDRQVSVLYAGDTKETVYLAEAANLTYKDKTTPTAQTVDLKAGDIVELSIDGNVIKRITDGALVKDSKAASVEDTTGLYIAKKYDNNTYTLAEYTAAEDGDAAEVEEAVDNRYVFASDVVVVMKDGNEFKVADLDDIKFLNIDGVDDVTEPDGVEEATRINKDNINGANALVDFVEYEEDGEKEIIAIIFAK